ncbi:MAG: hypothetical protein ACK5IH_02075 [Betaproteobacteria bacterium]
MNTTASLPDSVSCPARRCASRGLLAGGLLAPARLGGCAAFGHREPDAPQALSALAPVQPRPRPVSAARAAGARRVIAGDLSVRPGATPATGTPAQRERDRRRRARIAAEAVQADFLLHPDLPCEAGPWRSRFIDPRRRGEACARERLHALGQALLAGLGQA